jgi:internalin A
VAIFGGLFGQNNPQPTLEDLLKRIKQASNQQSKQHLLKQLIELAANQQLEKLNLSQLGLTELPPQIGKLTNLTVLRLGDNQITVIPEAIGLLTNLSELFLDRNQITHIPEAIGLLTNLSELFLDRNQITHIPEAIGLLTNLSELFLDRNQITHIPETIGNLSNLTGLWLGGNQITVIPEAIGLLTNLTGLWLDSNQITHIPEAIGLLTNLIVLRLDSNQITVIPEAIGNLTNLTELWLHNNQITVIPEMIGNLTNLTELWLDNNQITHIPEAIGNLTNLTELWLYNNQITHIPEAIGLLTNLHEFSLGDNQIASLPQSLKSLQELVILILTGNPIPIPPEILAGDAQSILSFYFQTQDGETEIIYEAKFIIVGEGGAGKTTLAKRLQDSKHVINPEQKSTEGIEIVPWKFSLPDGTLFRVNIWDFGGQEIYHATHQFFLTERSLYTLVFDTRAESPNLYYWLNVVRLLSNNSPIFILKNEKGDRECKLNERELRGEFDNLERSVAANIANNKKLKDIKETIRTHITKLPHLDIPIPKTWSKIRAELEKYAQQNHNYISSEAYYTLCSTYGFRERRQMLEISKYFHDLGICLHFQSEPLLKNRLILNPTWATNAVYKVTDTKKVRDNNGRFTKQDLQTIWHESKYADMHDELLELMQKFGICYPLHNLNNTYIVPSLLPIESPSYDWNPAENLIFRYKYDFMPKGIVTRFIIAINDLIEQQSPSIPTSQLVWRNGVILKDNNARAEVIESYNNKEIRIRVIGLQPTVLLAQIRREFKKIHDSYNDRLKYKELIPCNCSKCKDSQSPHDYPLEVLNKSLELNNPSMQCQKSFEMVSVRGLIDNIQAKDVPMPQEIDRAKKVTHRKKILILSANPQSESWLLLSKEVREIQNVLKSAKWRDNFEIILKGAVRPDDLRSALLDNEPEIVHFCGHGRGDDGLVLENDLGVQLVSTESLADLFQLFKSKIECVVLNACYSEVQAEAIYEHINCVVGMNHEIEDETAIKFAVGFYDALGAGRDYEDAFKFGRNAIDLSNLRGLSIPILKFR